MASLPRPAPSLTPPAGDCLVRASQKSAPNGTLVRLTSSPRAFNVSGALPATLMLIAETTSRGEHLLPTMPTWLRLAPVRPVGLEPTRREGHQSLNLACLPKFHHGHIIFDYQQANPHKRDQPVRPAGLEPTRPNKRGTGLSFRRVYHSTTGTINPASPGGRLGTMRT